MSEVTKPLGFCPLCEEDGAKQYATYARNEKEISCPRGHRFYDLADYGNGIDKKERKKINQTTRQTLKKAGEVGKEKPEELSSGTIDKNKPSKVAENSMEISDVDKARIKALVGDFTDASTLVGTIFAMKQELDEVKGKQENARKLQVEIESGDDGKILDSGDMTVSLVIPERHVEPIRDLASNWSASVTRYVNERTETLMDDMLYY